ncbi:MULTISPECIES: peptidylprolyl isomerase [unclassified Leisingera]|uniref:peptidylprolyl isomerase n=1 Tax=unclassified Leisingera TaxID=2614906 RepID=UPI0002E83BC1|nr:MULTISPECIES: peptidylprolyl isomerase [unclassified Leisingera]KIC33535.1 peptidylprolyl isomerase [Leisingera sp. ANG-S5]KIC53761.1 peptidylprolyl isomerase [Leisingera sp. ANG-S]KID10249.1 peptidylprolyl isomerase [Leisingera sp. ANG1]
MQQDVNTRFPAPFFSRALKSAAALALAAGLSLTGLPAAAQNLFAPAITVNDEVITRYELEQRARFQSALRVPGDPLETAREELINDRLKLDVLKQAGIELSDEDVTAGMEELAGRANLSLNEFLTALQQQGVAPQTLRDFTEVGLGWREYTRARFLSRARPTPEEIDRAMGSAGTGSVQVLLSEFIVPINEQNAAQVEELIEQVARLKSYDSFSAAAAQYSAAASRNEGGRLPWMPLTKLPPQLQEVVLALKPGEISEPLPLQNAVALFQMRGVREVEGAAPRYTAIEYAAYYLPGGRTPEGLAAAQKVVNNVDTCEDFYGLAQGQDPSVLEIQSLPPADIPRDIALELAKLDPSETSTALTRNNGQTLMVLMLCGRTADLGEGANRETVANALTAQRMTSLTDSFLEQLRSDARIDIK